MATADDLVQILAPKAGPGLGFRQGLVQAWNANTGQNTIQVAGAVLTDVPILNTSEAITLKAGHVVGLLTFGGSWFILGRITPPGDPNFAAASVAFGSGGVQAFNFALTTGLTTIASSTDLVVPDWADEALVHVTGSMSAVNSRGVIDSFGFRVGCFGGNGGTTFTDVDPGGGQNNAASSRNRFTGLSGGEVLTITGEALASGGAWSANPGNAVFIHAIAIYKSNV